MNRDDFNELREAFFDRIRETNDAKGHDYAGDEDALANFKMADERLVRIVTRNPAMGKWYIYFDKHLQAIFTFLEEGDVKSEPIDGRVMDCVLYLILLLGLIEDERIDASSAARAAELAERATRLAEHAGSDRIHVVDPPPGGAVSWPPLRSNPLAVFEERIKRGVTFDEEELASIRDELLLNGWEGGVELSNGRLRFATADIDLSVEVAK